MVNLSPDWLTNQAIDQASNQLVESLIGRVVDLTHGQSLVVKWQHLPSTHKPILIALKINCGLADWQLIG